MGVTQSQTDDGVSGERSGHLASHTQPRASGGRPPKFNPTEFIRQRKTREEDSLAARSRLSSPARTRKPSVPPSSATLPSFSFRYSPKDLNFYCGM
jgi:hypothetical protein